jgi:phosphoglycerate dehydrogenase-like enzyme
VTGLADSGIVLTNGQRIYGPDVADHVFAELLALTRNVKWSVEGKNSPKPGKTRWDTIHDRPWLERELRGRTMLIVGVGGIGGQIAQRAKGFGMRVVGIDPNLDTPRKNVDLLRPPAALKSLLPKADVLVLSCPLTEQTRGLIGAAEIALLPDDAYLINVARGRIVDHDALVAALREGQLAGAGMDVTEPEPLPDASPLWTMNNVVITPHIAGRSYGRNRRVFLLTRANIYRFAHGEPLLNVVDVERGY